MKAAQEIDSGIGPTAQRHDRNAQGGRAHARHTRDVLFGVRVDPPDGAGARNAAGKTLKRVMRDEYWKDSAVKI